MSNPIKFIYFDVGGVLILDFTNTNKWAELKRDLGFTAENEHIFEEVWAEHGKLVNLGFVIEQMVPALKARAALTVPENYSMLQDFTKRFEYNHSIWPVVKAAQKHYKLGLLTNMYKGMLDGIRAHGLFDQVVWSSVVDSSVEGCQKPDEQIFEIALERAGVKSSEILFVDNLARNTEAAEKLGWQVFRYDERQPEQASRDLARVLGVEAELEKGES